MKKYFITTFGCQANVADSERVAAMLEGRGMVKADSIESANHIVINTCMIRQKAEDRVYGLVNNLAKRKALRQAQGEDLKIVVTGCMVGMAIREKSGAFLRKIRERMPSVDEFLPIEEVGFDNNPIRTNNVHAWVPISNGCNNFCTFCVVPFTRGRELSRSFEDIISECNHLAKHRFKEITLIGQNVNSYGADLILGEKNVQVLRDLKGANYFDKNPKVIEFKLPSGKKVKPIYVKHLGRLRIPTLFPYLLEEVSKIDGIEKIDFISSNPWDFSDELIDTIAKNNKISRQLHIAVQSGDDTVLKRMNRWYTQKQFLRLISKLKAKIPNAVISTDIIVGFCGETDKQFKNTVKLAKEAQFSKAYVAIYSDRPGTAAHKAYKDNVPYKTKKERWLILENLINWKYHE
ncbi:MiaB/RimO family radical SAM methylthiotransferase [Candidatus Gottesmanbacteria bacterium]|nr:MiaB/RimO family radical SAM methylthiotransferase [Candidatus Gottesmanbacteria bacterium]